MSGGEKPTERATILIVDDESENVELRKKVLATSGHRLVTASSGDEALEIIERDPPDLILLDVMMPGMDGFEVCRRVKHQQNGVQFRSLS